MKRILFVIFSLFIGLQSLAHKDIKEGYHFTINNGQFDSNVEFYSRLKIGNMFLEKGRFTFDVYSGFELDSLHRIKNAETAWENKDGKPMIRPRQHGSSANPLKKHAYSMVFEGFNPNVAVASSGELSGYKNYFIGNDQSKWASNVPSFKSVNYTNLYPNIDMEVYTSFDWMKYDIMVNPGGNPNDISIRYEGVDKLYIEGKELVVKLSTGEIREVKLHAYQEIEGRQVTVACNYKLMGNQLSFDFPNGYDNTAQLVIDPVWIFSSLTGSTADNWGFTSTYDSQGNLYAAGIAFSAGYPTTLGAYDVSFNGGGVGGGFDISISKFNPTGTSLIYSTYLGGGDVEAPHSLVNDSQDNLILLGTSSSTNFPIVGAAYDPTFNGGWAGTYANMWGYQYLNGSDIVLAKFNVAGALVASTYIGGTDNEGLNESMVYNYSDQIRGEVVLDNNDNIYVCTSLWSADFPVTNGSIINNGNGWGRQDAVVFKMDGNFTTLNWSTYLGGSDYDAGYSIRYSQTGEVFVCGGTTSLDLGATAGTVGPTYSGGWDGYIASYNAITGAPVVKTYLGTASYDQAFILEVDINGDVYTVGQSRGAYPVFNAVYSNPGSKQFIQKISPNLTTSIYSTVFGSGSAAINISPTAFLVDNCGNVYVSGWGGGFNNSSSIYAYNPQAGGNVNGMPITFDAIQNTTDGNDFYFFVMERNAQSLLYGTYFGSVGTSEHTDGGTSRFDPNGVVYQSVCAACGTGNFPTTPGVWSTTSGVGVFGCNMGVIKFDMNFQGITATATVPANITLCSTNYTVNLNSSGSTPQQQWLFGDGSTSTVQNPTYTYADTGQYVVTFIAIDSSSCNIRDTAYFTVNLIQAPTFNASFNLPVIPPCSDPASVTVNATITGVGIDSTQWNMGDGTIYTDSTSISYSYTSQGIYPIEVIAWDLTCNVSDTIRDTLNFLTAISTAIATAPADTTLCSFPPFNMNFTSNGSTPNVYWDFGNGNTSSLANPSNIYADSGAYQVMFVAIDSMTCNVADTVYFNVTLNQAATFNASFNLPVIPPCSDPNTVTVNATITGVGIDSTQWNMGDGTIYADSTSVSYSYTSQGIYPIEVIAWDLTCNVSDTIRDTLNFITNISTATATAPADTTLCSSPPFNMNFTSNGSTPNVYWDFGNGNTSSLANPSNIYADSGAYQVMFVAIDSMTCNIADTVYFNVQLNQAAVFNATINVPTIPPCTNPLLTPLTASFTGSGADSLSWNLGDGTIYADSTLFTYFYTTPGIYTVTLTAWDFVCNNTNTISQIVDFNSIFSTATATAPADTTLCSSPPYNMSFTSNGSTPNVYWDFGDGNTSTLQNPSNNYADSGSYQVMFIAIDSNTCNIADTVYFNVGLIQAPTFSAGFNLPTIPPCSDPAVVTVNASFSGSGADSLLWNMGDGTLIYNLTNISYNYTNQGIYNIIVTAWDFCGNDTSITATFNFITAISTAVANAPSDTTLCTNPPFSISFTSGGTTPNQLWDFGDGTISTLANPTHLFTASGNYVVTYIAIDSTTCNIADTAVFNVSLIQAEQFSAELNFTPPPPCGSDSMLVQLNFTGTAADSLIWDMGNGDVFNSNNVSYYYTEPGIYNLTLTAFDFTCNLTEIISNEVPFYGNISTEVIIPNVFTPNGDGENDLLKFVNVDGSRSFSITIWNRWGKKVFVSNDPLDHWDGVSMKDKTIHEGVYYFEILFTDVCSEQEQIKTGFVHLMR